jgi:hypothetical protein
MFRQWLGESRTWAEFYQQLQSVCKYSFAWRQGSEGLGRGERGIKNLVSKLTGRLNLLLSNQISKEFLWAFGKALRLGWPIQDAERKTEREISQEVSRAISQKQTVN